MVVWIIILGIFVVAMAAMARTKWVDRRRGETIWRAGVDSGVVAHAGVSHCSGHGDACCTGSRT
jgi:hypothetical protein